MRQRMVTMSDYEESCIRILQSQLGNRNASDIIRQGIRRYAEDFGITSEDVLKEMRNLTSVSPS